MSDTKTPYSSDSKLEKVTKGKTKVNKKHDRNKVADMFLAEDLENVKTYLFKDVFIPSIRRLFADIVTNGANMAFLGDQYDNSRKKTSASRTSYSRYYKNDEDDSVPLRSRRSYSYEDVQFEDREDAENVLREMKSIIARKGEVSIAAYYDLSDNGSMCQHPDHDFGWTSLRGVDERDIVTNRNGLYIIRLPKAVPLRWE